LTPERAERLEWITRPHKSRSRKAIPPPSFSHKMSQRLRLRRLTHRLDPEAITTSLFLTNKVLRDRFMDQTDWPVPQRIGTFSDAAALLRRIARLDSVVVKPVRGSSSKGVFLLRRTDRSSWQDLRRGDLIDEDELLERLRAIRIGKMEVKSWTAEELLTGTGNDLGHPVDYKLYMFQDHVGLVLGKMHLPNDVRFRWWGPDWNPVETGKYGSQLDVNLPPPHDVARIVSVAQKVARELPTPFARIDLIEASSGVYVSEVSPLPGQFHRFDEGVDRALGLFWEEAEISLGGSDSWPRAMRRSERRMLRLAKRRRLIVD
jgi:hypothetical protein